MTSPAMSDSLSGPRVLLVEDDTLIAMDIAYTLRSRGFTIVGPCQTVAQSLALLHVTDCCDAVILDANLRGENAIPVATYLVQQGIPFIVVTGYSREQLPEELTVASVFVKPVNIEDLIGELRRILFL